jgi:hypothetical protein
MRVLLAALLAISVCACTPPGAIVGLVSKNRQNVTEDTMVLKRQPANFVDSVAEIGEELGYDLAGTDRAANTVRFTDDTNMLTSVFVGRQRQTVLTVSLKPNGRTVAFQLVISGNLKSATQEKVEERLSEFKTALRNRLS